MTMRSLILFLASVFAASAAPVPYPKNAMLLLDAGAKCLTAYSSPLGVTPNTSTAPKRPICAVPGAGERVRFWFSWQFNTPSGSNTACAGTCEIYWDMRHGDRFYWYEFVDSSGVALSPRKLSSTGKVTAEPNALETSIVLPIEMIGFRGYTRQIQFTASTVPSGTISLWMQVHAFDYQNKILIQLNNKAWISLNDSTVTFLDRASKFGGVGGGFRTMKIAVALAASSVTTGTNIIRFKLGDGNNISNGFRVLKFNIVGPAMNMTSIADSSNTATGTCSTTCGFGSTDDVYVANVTQGGMALNGFKTLASSSGTSLTFASSSVPDATYPKAGFNAAAIATAGGTGVPTITVRRSLITQAQFSTDDPSTWTAPVGSDSSAGATLANTAGALKDPAFCVRNPTCVIQAKCTSCHAVGLRDLKFFGFSNQAIKIRTMFHDGEEQEGDNIAAYARINAVTRCTNGRPWNPPYQPGAGLDAGTANCSSAGAGIDAVYERDADFAYDLGSMNFAATADLNVRETKLPIQFLDIAHWWPRIHPLDAFGATFTSSNWNVGYGNIRTILAGTYANTSAYNSSLTDMGAWMTSGSSTSGGYIQFSVAYEGTVGSDPATRKTSVSPFEIRRVYTTAQWSAIKSWELNHEFGLEGIYSTAYPLTAEPRGWHSYAAFDFSPNLLKLNGMEEWGALSHDEHMSKLNGQKFHSYLSTYWYFLQLVVNYHTGSTPMQRPQDWQYTYDFTKGFGDNLASDGLNSPAGALQLYFLVKGLQISVNNNGGPGACAGSGSCWYSIAPEVPLLTQHGLQQYNEIPAGDVPILLEKYLQAVFDHVQIYTRTEYLLDARTGAASAIERSNADTGTAGSKIWWALTQYKYRGVGSTLVHAFADWCATIWTVSGQDWNEIKTATCVPYQGDHVGMCTNTQ